MLNKKIIITILLLLTAGIGYGYRIQRPIRYQLPWTDEQIKELNNTLEGLFLSQQGRYETDIVSSSKTNARNGETWILDEGTTFSYQFKAGDSIYSLNGGGGDMFKSTYDTNNNNVVDSVDSYAETDPQVGAVTNAKWCAGDGSAVQCNQDAPSGGSPAGDTNDIQFNYGGAFTADSNFTFRTDDESFWVGWNNTEIGADNTMVIGANNVLSSSQLSYVHILGNNNTVSAGNEDEIHIVGDYNTAKDSNTLIFGSQITANDNSIIIGKNFTAPMGTGAIMLGINTIDMVIFSAGSPYQPRVGIGNINPGAAFVVGSNTFTVMTNIGSVVFTSPDGTCSKCGVTNDDIFACASVTCP